MVILIVMCIGAALGRFVIPDGGRKIVERLQVVCTLALIFSLGVTLGRREDFFTEIITVGMQSVIFCLLPTLGSIALVWFLTDRKQGERKK